MAILEEVVNPFVRIIYGIIDALPGVIAAILILIVGYFGELYPAAYRLTRYCPRSAELPG